MHSYRAAVRWSRSGDEDFVAGKYSRAHEWSFDGGIAIPASASPLHVPLPFSSAEAVDPEEALVAAASSCHMLMFLYLAAKRGFSVESYEDEAEGSLARVGGKLCIERIALRPTIRFSGTQPTASELAELHHAAHDECYIANSLKTQIMVESPAAVRP